MSCGMIGRSWCISLLRTNLLCKDRSKGPYDGWMCVGIRSLLSKEKPCIENDLPRNDHPLMCKNNAFSFDMGAKVWVCSCWKARASKAHLHLRRSLFPKRHPRRGHLRSEKNELQQLHWIEAEYLSLVVTIESHVVWLSYVSSAFTCWLMPCDRFIDASSCDVWSSATWLDICSHCESHMYLLECWIKKTYK